MITSPSLSQQQGTHLAKQQVTMNEWPNRAVLQWERNFLFRVAPLPSPHVSIIRRSPFPRAICSGVCSSCSSSVSSPPGPSAAFQYPRLFQPLGCPSLTLRSALLPKLFSATSRCVYCALRMRVSARGHAIRLRKKAMMRGGSVATETQRRRGSGRVFEFFPGLKVAETEPKK
ncbi:hypothetical protein niasHT_000237 [Heterodera trifolii]|uniref:Uncharacterized protein n=1 Tax=Heterodera trifolii TaxID=157864 RepID=A0ABD2LW26_9BILA